jgi:hypothetical protein
MARNYILIMKKNSTLTRIFDTGMVTWNEFSSFVLDMHTKGEKLAHGDSVFDGSCIEEKDEETHHDNSILWCEYMPQQSLLVTAALDGSIKTWHANTGNAYAKHSARCVWCVCVFVCVCLCVCILMCGQLPQHDLLMTAAPSKRGMRRMSQRTPVEHTYASIYRVVCCDKHNYALKSDQTALAPAGSRAPQHKEPASCPCVCWQVATFSQ